MSVNAKEYRQHLYRLRAHPWMRFPRMSIGVILSLPSISRSYRSS